MAELLINLGADVNAIDNLGSTPVHVLLAFLGNVTSAIELLEEDWDNPPVSLASSLPALAMDLTRLMVSNGGNIHAENSTDHSPLSLVPDQALRTDMIFFSRRSLLLFFCAVCAVDDLKNNVSLQRIAGNIDVRRYIVTFV